jgi:hypothetical protein
MRLPDDLSRSFFGREFFHRVQPAVPSGTMIDDLLTA